MASSLPLLVMLCALNVAHSQIRIYDLKATDLRSSIFSTSDGFVKISYGSVDLGKTSVQSNTVSPWWPEEFSYFKAQSGDVLLLEVYDNDLLFDDLLGVCQRSAVMGTHSHECYLEKGGTLHYTYTLQ